MPIKPRKLKDGTTVYDVREQVGFRLDGKPDRKSVTCATKAEAKLEQAKMVAKRDAMRNRSGRYRFDDYVEERWWPSLADRSPTTRDTYEKRLRLNLLPHFAGRDIGDIDHISIQRMADSCPTDGVARQAVSVLKTILNYAMNQDQLIMRNPACGSFTWGQPRSGKRDCGVVLTSFAAIRPVMDAVREYGDKSLLKLALTGFYMGLRPEERYALDWSDFDWQRRFCTVDDAFVVATAREGGNQVKATKTKKGDRVVPMTRDVRDELMSMSRNGNVLFVGPVLKGQTGKRLSPSTARKRWRRFYRWCEERGKDLPYVTIENMRHSFATSYLAAGGKVERLREIMGHTDVATTYRYVRPSVEDLRDSMDEVVNL